MTWQDVRGHYIDPEPPEPLGTCMEHGDYWTDDCTQCGRPARLPDPGPPPAPAFCDHWIEVEGDPWAGTVCKLLAGHEGEHSAHYPVAHPRFQAKSEEDS